VRVTPGGYALAVLAAVASALTLPAAAPGRPGAAYLAAGIGVAALLLASLVMHEIGHALVARRHGAQVGEIAVGFLGTSRHGGYELPGPKGQWRTAAAGPAVSIALAGVMAGAAAGLAAAGIDRLGMLILGFAALANGVFGVLSVLPGTGPDGGRIVRALTWARTGNPAKADMVAARAGQVTGVVVTLAGIAIVALGYLTGLWLALLGVLAFASSRGQARQLLVVQALAGLRVRDIVPLNPAAPRAGWQSWQTVESFLAELAGRAEQAERQAAPGTAVFPLHDFDGRPAGLLTLSQLAAVPPDGRESLRLRDIATPLPHLVTTTADEPLTGLLGRLTGWPKAPAAVHTAGHALVLDDDGMLAGIITPADLTRAGQLGALRRTR
jgi:Zn-dependent protease